MIAVAALLAPLTLTGCAQHVVEVAVRDLQFTPQDVIVEVGDTVRWRFDDDGLLHHVVADDGSFESPMSGTSTFEVVFTKPGTYPYSCSIHPYMTGTVIVSG